MGRVGIKDIGVGDIFEVKGGTIEVLRYENREKIYIKHNDLHAHCMWTRKDAIEKGMVKNPYFKSVEGVGYFGVGRFKTTEGGKLNEEYSAWRSMLSRCYNENSRKKYPTYAGCTVHEDWHNFQVFAEWYTRELGYRRGYHLDKDILFRGNKEYSAKNCCLVPREINGYFSSTPNKNNGLPTGVYKTKYNTFRVEMSLNDNKKRLGTYKTLDSAIYAYSNAKGIRAKQLALENKSNIPYRVFLAIVNWDF